MGTNDREKDLERQKVNKLKSRIRTTIIVVVLMVIMSIVASIFTKKSIRTAVEKQFSDASLYYATAFNTTVCNLRENSLAILSLLEKDNIKTKEDMRESLKYINSLLKVPEISDVWLIKRDGNGIDYMGQSVKSDSEELLGALAEKREQYLLCKNDKDEQMICFIHPLQNNDYTVCVFFNPAHFRIDTATYHFDMYTMYGIIDEKGDFFIYESGSERRIKVGDNLMERFESQMPSKKILYEMSQKHLFSFEASVGGVDRYVVLRPTKINDWYFLLATPESYVNIQIKKYMSGVKYLLLFAGIGFGAVFVLIVMISITNTNKIGAQNKTLQMKAEMDLLTELNNKIATEQKIKEYIAEKENGRGMMFVIDIDNFKKVNDTMGHAFGDEVLSSIARRLKAEFRSTDIIGRFGGDEFVLFLKDINTDDLIKKEADKLEGIFKNCHVGTYTKYTVTASIGCSIYPDDAKEFDKLFKAADSGLYRAKQAGKNRLCFYRDELNKQIGQDV